jgi:LmbE family N-acetylglucosaminyl deacetylase
MALSLLDRFYAPTSTTKKDVLNKSSSLVIVAHQDDIEIAAANLIAALRHSNEQYVTGIVTTDGARAPRSGKYADYTDPQMAAERIVEQNKAAELGNFGVFQLGHPTPSVLARTGEGSEFETLVQEIQAVIMRTKPEIIYVHSPLDGHPTHNATTAATFEALKRLPPEFEMPKQIIGCEVWRGLDWLPNTKDYPLTQKLLCTIDMSGAVDCFKEIIACHQTQIVGGTDYERTVVSRWQANVMANPHKTTVDAPQYIALGLDLTEFVQQLREGKATVDSYFQPLVQEFVVAAQKSITGSSPMPNTMVSAQATSEALVQFQRELAA